MNKTARFLLTALYCATGLAAYGAMAMPPVLAAAAAPAVVTNAVVVPTGSAFPAVSSTVVNNYNAACNGVGTSTDAVPICQQPLTIQPSVPPDITLMLDDSGSMSWNFMPDWSYLQNNNNNDAVIDASNNGVYYNPAVTYTPPPQVSGTLYTNQTDMTNVPVDGFGARTTATVNLFTYNGNYDYYDCGGVCGGSAIKYNVSNTVTSNVVTTQTVDDWHSKDSYCQQEYNNQSGSFGGYTFTPHTGTWYLGGVKESGGGECTFQYKQTQTVSTTYNFFQYSTGPAAGPYTVYYVTANAGDCQYAPTVASGDTYGGCVGAGDTSGTAAPAKDASGNALTAGNNIANWLAYYHTRILMAKTGLMTAFNTLNPNYRFGFGSIDGGGSGNKNYLNLPSSRYSYSDNYNGGTNYIAQVAPFGAATDSSSQRANFWTWISQAQASGGTPLRQALGQVGQYYQASQPWTMMSSDPGYVSGGTNDTVIACRQAYTILTTDGFWNDNSPGVGDVDGTTGPTITGPNSASFTYSPVLPFSDTQVTTTTSYQSADCSQYSATLDPTGATSTCNWTGIKYADVSWQYKYDSRRTTYSCSSRPYSTYDYCNRITDPDPGIRYGNLGKTQYAYGAGVSCSSSSHDSCTNVSGSYDGCSSSGGTWDASKRECKVITTTTSGTAVSNTLADVAMKYWNQDLQSGIANEVPTNSEDPAFWQHMVTFTMGLGFTPVGITPAGTTTQQIFDWSQSGGGTTTGQDGKAISPSNPKAISGFSWPTPSSNSQYNIADLEHAGVNGHGGFFSATDPTTFISGLQTALNRAAERAGSGASLAANSTQLQTGTVAYQATYQTAIWTGDLQAYAINQSDGSFASTASWSASTQLVASATPDATTGVLTYPSRLIKTYNPSAASGSQFVSFSNASATTPPSLSTAELAALGSTAAAQANMVNYLRGDATNEGNNGSKTYRARNTPLGDIIDSQPVYSGAPNPNAFVGQTFTGSSSYSTFATTNASRTGLIYVSGNDGMLHAFNASNVVDATTGKVTVPGGLEVFAYLPGAVITAGVSNIANTTYGTDANPHQDYNDGQLTIADAYFAEGTDAAAWHTVLVGTTGRGSAKAIYALDITNTSSIKFLWERSAGDGLSGSNYIGQMIGKPVIALTSTDATKGPTWSVLVGNGYNSAKNQAALLQFDLGSGTLYVHTTSSNASANGLAAPVTWIGNSANGLSTDAYAGDLLGHVWDFQLNGTSCTTASPPVCTTTASPTSAGTLLFTAQDSSNNAQPITAGLLAGMDPDTGYVWVFFGTGKYLQYNDVKTASPQTQAWYGLIVQQNGVQPTALPITPSSTSGGQTYMVQRYITGETAASGNTLAGRTVTPTPVPSDMTGRLGWFMNLQSPTVSGGTTTYSSVGEMMVDPNQFQGNLLLGTTRIPVVTDVCNPSGTGWVMALNPFTGTSPSNNFFDLNGDGTINSGDEIGGKVAAGVGFSSMPNAPIFVGGSMLTSFENASKTSLGTGGATGSFERVSWREIVNQ